VHTTLTRLLSLFPSESSRIHHAIVCVVLIAVLSKLTLALLIFSYSPSGVFESTDSFEYQQLAINLGDHGIFSRATNAPFEPEILRSPAYPLFLSGLYRVFGTHPLVVVLAQIALSAITGLAVFGIGSLLFSRQTGLLAALFFSADPVSIYYSQVLLTETLFTTLLTLCLFFLLRTFREPWLLRLSLATGFVLALATYTRPTSYYLGALFPLALAFVTQRSHGWRRALVTALIMFSAYAMCVGSWQARNYLITGSTEFSQAKNQYLFVAKAAAIIAARDNISLEDAQKRLAEGYSSAMALSFRRASPTQIYESQGRYAWSVIEAHPLLFLWTTTKGAVANLLGPSNLSHLFGLDNVALRTSLVKGELSGHSPAQWILALSSWAYGLGFLMILYMGIVVLLRCQGLRSAGAILLALTAIYIIVVSSGPEAYSRFRAPIMPLLCILASAGFMAWARAPLEHPGCDELRQVA